MAKWFTHSEAAADDLVTFLNDECITQVQVVSIVHDGTNFVLFYHR